MTQPAKPTLLQALADKRMTAILLLGFASGLPLNLTGSTLQAWLAQAGVDIKTIGIFSLVGLPYVFKMLWAPLLDRDLPPLLGRRRGWIFLYQVALAFAIMGLGWSSPAQAPYALGLVALLVAFLSASQDIVIDAYRVDVIPPPERALAAAATAFGYRSAAMFAGTVTLILAGHLGWRAAYGLVALVMGLTVLATLRSFGLVPDAASQPVTRLASLFTVVSMAALGLGVDVRVLARVGGRVTLAVTGSLVLLLVVSLSLIWALKIA